MTTQRIYVSGRVQAVGYRDWVVRTAKAIGITGWVRNLRDGRVEMVATGEEDALSRFADACREGPALAKVEHVEAFEAAEEKREKGFTKRFTA
ncbi:MAG: acylphosphatase [Sphingomonadales bacterium]|nr:MAG: acylphosphatase [Sphingomonadales bacterium]